MNVERRAVPYVCIMLAAILTCESGKQKQGSKETRTKVRVSVVLLYRHWLRDSTFNINDRRTLPQQTLELTLETLENTLAPERKPIALPYRS